MKPELRQTLLELGACCMGAALGVVGLWVLGAPLSPWSGGALGLLIAAFSFNCLAGGPVS